MSCIRNTYVFNRYTLNIRGKNKKMYPRQFHTRPVYLCVCVCSVYMHSLYTRVLLLYTLISYVFLTLNTHFRITHVCHAKNAIVPSHIACVRVFFIRIPILYSCGMCDVKIETCFVQSQSVFFSPNRINYEHKSPYKCTANFCSSRLPSVFMTAF